MAVLDIARHVFEILILWMLIYILLWILRGSRGLRVLVGVMVGLLAFQKLASWLSLPVLVYLSRATISFMPIFLVVVFRDELHRVMMSVLGRPFFPSGDRIQETREGEKEYELTSLLVPALRRLSMSNTGALIAIEQEVSLAYIADFGHPVQARLLHDSPLLDTIFYEGSPMHDGGIVIRDDVVVAAGCQFPMPDNGGVKDLSRNLGMRHRAAVSLSEQTDAVVLVVSEETGRISLAHEGKLTVIGNDVERMAFELNRSLQRAKEVVIDRPILMELHRGFYLLGQRIRRSLGMMRSRGGKKNEKGEKRNK
ncbi:MAG: hypothetical protein GX561_12590 [Lentisphaerae bacterium]|jgi:diadenylate cyclase|nr:hypothetical protein [Lentisphaerota bacterium]